jgi:hypothetical protein
MADKKLINFYFTGAELDMFEDLMEVKKVNTPRMLIVLLMAAELERIHKRDK